jgi:hypothetical protein
MEFRCPYCNSPIYSRKNKICGVCEKSLPPELLLNDAQIKSLKEEMAKEEKETRQFKKQMNDLGSHSHGGGFHI